jgi:predicted Zn-dependent peptidase
LYNTLHKPKFDEGEWRNGRRDRLKICCPLGRVGSTPTSPTILFMTELPIIKTLENGLRVVYTPFPNIDSVTFRLMGRAGFLCETPKEYVLANFLEHMAFEGTKKYPKSDDLIGLVKNVGGKLNANTGDYYVTYETKVLTQDAAKAFDLLSQQVMYPLLRKKDIEKQRTIITQEYHMYRDNPIHNFHINSNLHFYNRGSRFQYPIIGTLEVINELDRNAFQKYFTKNYSANNFVLSVCGGDIEDQVFKLAKTYFGEFKSGSKAKYTYSHISDTPALYTESNEKIKQATISIVFLAPEIYSDEFYASRYVSNIIGGGFLSRLFLKIRQEHGLAYRAGCRYYASVPYGTFDHYAQVDPVNIEKVLLMIKTEIERMANEGITKDEYNRSKKEIDAFFSFRNESPAARAKGQGRLVLEDQEGETLESMKNKLLSVTMNQINKTAQHIYEHHPKIRVLSNKITDQQISDAWQS